MFSEDYIFKTAFLMPLLLSVGIFISMFSGSYAGIIVYEEQTNIEQFADRELPFAQALDEYGIEGAIVHANPPEACTNISRPPDLDYPMNWFVLVAGNFCDYDTKIINSAFAGYSAAVIYSNRGRDDGPFRHKHAGTLNISAITIRTRSGLIIKENYLYTINNRFRVFIYPNNAIKIMTFLLLFAVVAGIFVIVLFSFTVIRFVQQVQYQRRNRLSTQHLKRLQTSKFKKGDPYETCAICLDDFKKRERLRILPCFHAYHAKCIDPWLTKNRRICPVCKKKVILTSELSENDMESSEEREETTPLLSSTDEQSRINSNYGTNADSQNQSNQNTIIVAEIPYNVPFNNGANVIEPQVLFSSPQVANMNIIHNS